ncbi:MAG: hypothetical protein HY314_08575 [Acidobacteria bacterium]|nr:hypothetical protein [Acidobacteriota bacterium]
MVPLKPYLSAMWKYHTTATSCFITITMKPASGMNIERDLLMGDCNGSTA